MRRIAWLGPTLGLSLLVATGCSNGEVEGQVIARVDGEEITRRELLAEHEALGIGASLDHAEVRANILDRLIERRLFARAARDALVDRTPAFQAEARRLREMLLVERYRQRLEQGIAPPGDAEVEAYIARHPYRFAGREAMLVDRIQVVGWAGTPPVLDGDTTFDQLAARIEAEGFQPVRDQRVVDTGVESIDLAALLARSGDGAIAWTGQDGVWQAMRIVQRWPIDMPDATHVENAKAALMRERLDAVARHFVERLRAGAEIEIQSGFELP